ncbi:MAG TPA: tail fiber domain-containing protein [Phycisphaerae bacterium]|nr:tail fiber domain-containing protein [Phycisphaerae bacterium]
MMLKTVCMTAVVTLGLIVTAPAAAQGPIGTTFAYQGQLKQGGLPATATADFQFVLWDALAGGNQIGAMIPVSGKSVVNGLFTVTLDFGAGTFAGNARWLEIAVRSPAGAGGYTTLTPRQELTPAPNALYAVSAGSVPSGMTGSGTTNYIPKFTGASTLGNSVVYQNGSSIGIGTTDPGEYAKLHVHSDGALIKITSSATGTDYGDGALFSYFSTGSSDACLWNRENASLIFGTNNTDRMRITSNGNVGIGLTDPSERLDTDGTARLRGIPAGSGTTVVADANGKLWKQSSSRRYKTDIRDLSPQTDAVLDLQPVAFRWQTTGNDEIGLIAEDVAETLPELVVYDAKGQPDAVKYDKLALYLLDVVKAQHEQIGTLQCEKDAEIAAQFHKLAAQDEEISELRTRLARIEELVATLADMKTGGAR